MEPQQHIHNRISSRALEYAVMDHKNLQTRYSNRVLRGGKSLFFRMSKKKMIGILLETEFGKPAIKEYREQCREWDACKWFVEDKT